MFTRPIGPALWALFMLFTPVLSACNGASIESILKGSENQERLAESNGQGPLDQELSTLIKAQKLTGNPAADRDIPNIHTPLAQLGKALFFSKTLGGEEDSACVSCHHPSLAGGDALSLSVGVGAVDSQDSPAADLLGSGRFHLFAGNLPPVPRNAPTTFNLAIYDEVLFWDARVESVGKEIDANGTASLIVTPDSSDRGSADTLLALGSSLTLAQARFPVTSDVEMRGGFIHDASNEALREQLATRFYGKAKWEAQFVEVFGDATITFERIVQAIAAYENSQLFIDNPWKAYVEGDIAALTEEQKRGATLFFNPVSAGGAGCASCHQGDFFTDESVHLTAFPQIGIGKGDDSGQGENDDFGRARVSGNDRERYHFRTPSLLNITQTGPYGHAGTFDNLETLIRYHLDPENGMRNFFGVEDGQPYQREAGLCQLAQIEDIVAAGGGNCADFYPYAYANTQNAIATLNSTSAESPFVERASLDDEQMRQLVAFLAALTDPCIKDRNCLAPWILQEGDKLFDDENMVIAIDKNGDAL